MPIVPKKGPTPRRDHLPVKAGCEPGWDLTLVETNYLIAELIRRGYRNFVTPTTKKQAAAPTAQGLFD